MSKEIALPFAFGGNNLPPPSQGQQTTQQPLFHQFQPVQTQPPSSGPGQQQPGQRSLHGTPHQAAQQQFQSQAVGQQQPGPGQQPPCPGQQQFGPGQQQTLAQTWQIPRSSQPPNQGQTQQVSPNQGQLWQAQQQSLPSAPHGSHPPVFQQFVNPQSLLPQQQASQSTSVESQAQWQVPQGRQPPAVFHQFNQPSTQGVQQNSNSQAIPPQQQASQSASAMQAQRHVPQGGQPPAVFHQFSQPPTQGVQQNSQALPPQQQAPPSASAMQPQAQRQVPQGPAGFHQFSQSVLQPSASFNLPSQSTDPSLPSANRASLSPRQTVHLPFAFGGTPPVVPQVPVQQQNIEQANTAPTPTMRPSVQPPENTAAQQQTLLVEKVNVPPPKSGSIDIKQKLQILSPEIGNLLKEKPWTFRGSSAPSVPAKMPAVADADQKTPSCKNEVLVNAIGANCSWDQCQLRAVYCSEMYLRQCNIRGGAFNVCTLKNCTLTGVAYCFDCTLEQCTIESNCVLTRPSLVKTDPKECFVVEQDSVGN